MKKIEAIIRPNRFEELKSALDVIDVKGMTVYDVMGRGMQKGQTQYYRGLAHSKDLLAKIKVEIVCQDQKVEEIIQAIITTCKTGRVGDGKIFIYPVERVIRISSEETDNEAL